MVKKIITVILMMVFLSSFVLAQGYSGTEIRIKTLPGHTVYLSVLDVADNSYAYEILKGISDQYGDVFFNYSANSTDKDYFDLRVKVKKASVQVIPKLGLGVVSNKSYNVGEEIYIQIFNEGDEPILTPGLDVIEEVIEVIENVTSEDLVEADEELLDENENNNESLEWLTGYSISELITSPVGYGGGAGILILIVLSIFLIIRKKNKKKVGVSDKLSGDSFVKRSVKNNSSVVKSSSSDVKSDSHNGDLSSAEARLKEVQAEIQRLKNKDKVSEVRKKIMEEEEELRKLRNGRI